MSFKVETARFNFVSTDAEPKLASDGLPIVQSVRWQEYLEMVLNAGGQFIELRRTDEYEEMTVAYPTGPAGSQGNQAPQRQAQPTGWNPYPDEDMQKHISDAAPFRASQTSDELDRLING